MSPGYGAARALVSFGEGKPQESWPRRRDLPNTATSSSKPWPWRPRRRPSPRPPPPHRWSRAVRAWICITGAPTQPTPPPTRILAWRALARRRSSAPPRRRLALLPPGLRRDAVALARRLDLLPPRRRLALSGIGPSRGASVALCACPRARTPPARQYPAARVLHASRRRRPGPVVVGRDSRRRRALLHAVAARSSRPTLMLPPRPRTSPCTEPDLAQGRSGLPVSDPGGRR
jgi:hypothetical protein